MVAPAPADGSAGPPAAGIVMVMLMAGRPGIMLVVPVMGADGGAALPARPLAVGVIVTGVVLLRPATSVPVPAVAVPSGGVASVPAWPVDAP